MFESAFPYPYYLVIDESINIYNLHTFQVYLNKIKKEQRVTDNYDSTNSCFSDTSSSHTSTSNKKNNKKCINTFSSSCTDFMHVFDSSTNLENTNGNNNDKSPKFQKNSILTKKKYDKDFRETVPKEDILEDVKLSERDHTKTEKRIYFFQFTKIFDMKPNFRFVAKKY